MYCCNKLSVSETNFCLSTEWRVDRHFALTHVFPSLFFIFFELRYSFISSLANSMDFVGFLHQHYLLYL